MANQLTIRINLDDGIAAVSGITVAAQGGITIQDDAPSGTITRNRVLAVAAMAGSPFLAVTAAAEHVGGHEEINPIFYPEFWMGFIAGAIVTFGVMRYFGRKPTQAQK